MLLKVYCSSFLALELVRFIDRWLTFCEQKKESSVIDKEKKDT